MDELVNLVSKKTGIPKAQAKVAVEIVIGFLKDKLPAPIAGQLDSVISGGGGMDMDKLGDVAKGLGGMFGKK